MEITEKTIRLNIKGEGEALVLLHGALVDSSMWKHQINAFSKSFKVVTLDLPGHGESKNIILKEYSISEIAKCVVNALKSNGIYTFVLCGHSFGGIIAQEIALNYPDLVNALILAETSYGTRDSFVNNVLTNMTNSLMKLTTQKQLIKLSAKSYGKGSSESSEYIKMAMSAYSIEESRKVMNAVTGYSSLNKLKDLKVNTLILVGDKNKQTHSQGKRFNKEINQSQFNIISNAHHLLNMDNPIEFNAIVLKFLYNLC
ncbi:MAG: alpha/beta hydrolase [Clostridia bacterium]|nr:alpha/beta hydrolase [Clostridia bacterium]